MRIVDLTAFWAGPSATHSLAAFGADVIKIESIQRPDGIRYSGGMRTDVDDWWEYGWVFHAMNTNKRSVTLDLESADGIRLFKQLVSQADAVIENFSPRVMDQFGLGADALLASSPRLVVVRMPAFGLTGPWRDRVGFAPTMEQIAGLAWVTGLPEGPPVPPRGACDPLAGAHAAFALLAALEFADRTGRGQLVEVPMIETVLNVTATQTIEFEVFGEILEAGQSRPPGREAGLYRCAGDDNWIAVRTHRCAAEHVCREYGRSEPSSATGSPHRTATSSSTALASAGIPAAAVVSPSVVTENPQLRHRGFFERLDHPSTGEGLYPPRRSHRSTARKLAASAAADAGAAQHRGADRACGLTDDRPRSVGRAGCHRHQAEGPVRRAYRGVSEIAISS